MPKRGATAIPNITMRGRCRTQPVTTLPNATETALTADGLEFSDKEMTVKSRTDPLSLSGLCPLERSDVTSFMDFLKRVRPAGTTPDPASFAKQVQRYETMWVPFMKKHATTGARGDVCLCPPPDVHFAWIAHMLNPKAYEKDTQRVFGRVIDHNVADIEGKEKKTRPLWEAMFGPGSWGADHVPTKTEDRGAPLASCDLAAACKRQSGFWYQLSLPHHTEPAFLKESFARYRKFLLLTKTEPKLFSVPTYDIDLVWHCHQLHPLLYASETRRLLGTMLGHDDSVDDRSEGSKLINGWDATQAAWKAAYGESYAREGAMHRGQHPTEVFRAPPADTDIRTLQPQAAGCCGLFSVKNMTCTLDIWRGSRSELVFGVEGTAEWLSALTVRCTGFTGTGTPTLDVVDDDDGSLYARVQQHTPGHVLPPGPGAPFLVQDIRGDVAVVRGRWTGSENFTFTVEDLRPGQNNTYSGSWVGGQDSKLHLHDTWGIAVDLKKGEVSFSFKNKKHAGVHPASPVAVHLAVALAMVAARSATQPDGKTAALIPCREGGWILGILGNREARDRREREEAARRQKKKLQQYTKAATNLLKPGKRRQKKKLQQYTKAATNLLKHMSEDERPMVREAVKEIDDWVDEVSDIATKEDFEGKLTEIAEKIGAVVAAAEAEKRRREAEERRRREEEEERRREEEAERRAAACGGASSSGASCGAASCRGCFGSSSTVDVVAAAGAVETRRVADVRAGDVVLTAGGARATVLCVVVVARSTARPLVELEGGLVVSSGHPVRVGGTWRKPGSLSRTCVPHDGTVYNFVLDCEHVLLVNGVECVTLGHGLAEPAVAHSYWGTEAVLRDLEGLPGWADGRVRVPGFARDGSGRVVGLAGAAACP